MHEHLEQALRHFAEDVAVLAVLISKGRNPIAMKRRGQGQQLGSLTRGDGGLILSDGASHSTYTTVFHVVLDGWVVD